jgi:hypothetical protein
LAFRAVEGGAPVMIEAEMTEAEMLATFEPCIDGPISNVAIQLIGSGKFALYHRTRAAVVRILEAHKAVPRKSRNKDQRKGELLDRWRIEKQRRAHGRGFKLEFIKSKLRKEFADLTDSEFESTIGPKPPGRIATIASQIASDRNSVGRSRLESDPFLISAQPNEGG